jgi:hypothetical protein
MKAQKYKNPHGIARRKFVSCDFQLQQNVFQLQSDLLGMHPHPEFIV